MTSPPQEVVFEDGSRNLLRDFVVCVAVSGGAVWLGFKLGGLAAICLFLVAGIVLAFLIYITQLIIRVGPNMFMLTSEGLVYKLGGRRDVLPPEAIEAVGLVRYKQKGRPAELMLWYDPSRVTEMPKSIRRRESASGQIRLTAVMDEPPFFPPHRVKEVRELVQAHKLGEWRNRSTGEMRG